MSSKTPHTQPEGRLLFAVLLPFLMILAWCLRDSLAYVQETTPTGVGIFWQESEASLNLRLGCPPNNPLTEYGPCWDDAARDAARQWNAVGANFTFRISPSRPVSVSCTSSDVDGINTVVWADTQCGMAFGENTLAVTHLWFHDSSGEIVDSDVHFNSNEDWSTYSGPRRFGAIDFHRVAIHEFGHVLGLDHPDDHGQSVNAIMNSKADDTDRLQADDIAGIRAIYGGGGGQPDPDYCRDFGPCPAGKGDCDSNSECQAGLTCVNDVGARYGLPAHYDVCEVGARPDPDYCVRNYCGLGDGDCDPGQCDEGVCVNDVGPRYGLPSGYDVCEAGSHESSLNDLLGTWRFTGRIGSQSYEFSYRLERIDTSTGTPLLTGTDLSDNVSVIVAGRIKDIDATSILPYEYALLDAEPSVCGFYVFNKTGINRVSGRLVLFEADAGRLCTTTVFGSSSPNGYAFTGTRTSRTQSSIQEQSTPRDTVLGQPNVELQSLEETMTLSLSSPDEADSVAIRYIIDTLSPALD